jgi:hypothetical protein
MATKPFIVDGNIVVDEATLSSSTTSLILPVGSTITGGGILLDATNSDTDDLTEGVTNLYFTDARADARIALQAGANLDLSSKSTTDLAEGTNLYYTDTRADARITAASITDLSDADQSVQTTDNVTFANITATGYIAGPATFTIDPAAVGDATGTVVILGDLQVDGTTTTINSTTLDVDDLNITVASGAANAAAANGAGLTVDGASATLTYDSANDRWAMNKSLDVNGTVIAGQLNLNNIGTFASLDSKSTISTESAFAGSDTDFRIKTTSGNVNHFVVQATTGDIGIGTDSPNSRLEVNETITFNNADTFAQLNVKTTSGNLGNMLNIGVDETNELSFLQSMKRGTGYKPLILQRYGGNVGIGTDNPSELLHANGNIRLTTNVSTTRRLYALSGTGPYALNSSGGAAIAFHRDATNNDEIAFETHWQGNQHAERMRIDNQGNVGIGETNPAGKLEVQNTSVNYAILGTSNKGHYFESQSDDNTDGFEIYQQHGSTASRNSFIVNDNRTGSKSAAFVVRGDGNVGIGTDSPSSLLDVDKSQNSETNIEITNTNTGADAQVRTKYTTDGGLFTVGKTSNAHVFGGDAYIYNVDNTNIRFATSDVERVRIHSAGRVGIGTTGNTIQGSLVVKDVTDHNGADVFVVAQNGNASRVAGYKVFDEGGTASLEMKYDNGGNNAIIRNPNNGSLAIYLGGTGAANALDDYEEGEWTYSLPCTTSGSFNVRAGYQKGFYTKIGRLVTIHLRYETSGSSSPSGDIELHGLPFNVDSTIPTNGNASFTYPILLRGASSTSYEWDYSFHIGLIPGTTTGKFYGQGDGSTHSYRALQPGDISSNFEGSICLTYKTNQ